MHVHVQMCMCTPACAHIHDEVLAYVCMCACVQMHMCADAHVHVHVHILCMRRCTCACAAACVYGMLGAMARLDKERALRSAELRADNSELRREARCRRATRAIQCRGQPWEVARARAPLQRACVQVYTTSRELFAGELVESNVCDGVLPM